MAGLVPAIHVLLHLRKKDVEARHKAGHDEFCRKASLQSRVHEIPALRYRI